MSFRVALVGIYHESNTFVTTPTVLDDFKNGQYLKGEAIRKEYQHAHNEIGGMLEVLDKEGIEAIPLLFASATPGGTITSETYNFILNETIEELKKVLP
ncbi:MAG: M81 family metallopeptidase, partial [Bacteroidetes bacterium]|nr:M81 family metallopeptidase [Bacteroidota bacterium]